MIGLDSDYKKDSMLAPLMETVDKIASYPFIGCEAELARLNKIAIDYAIEALKHLRREVKSDATKIDNFTRQIREEISYAEQSSLNAQTYEELNNLLDDLKAHIATNPNMVPESQTLNLPL